MIPERYLELMHGEIDAVNTPSESAELTAYLDAHPAARAEYRDLRRAAEALGAVRDEDPPPGLQGRILAAVTERVAARGGAEARAVSRRGLGERLISAARPPRLALRYAACGAAGLALGLALALLLSRGLPAGAPGEMEALYGALHGRWAPPSAGPVVDMTADGIVGRARAARLGEEWIVVQIDLDAPPGAGGAGVEVAHPAAVEYAGVWGLGGVPAVVAAGPARLAFDHSGKARYLLLFRDDEHGAPEFRVALTRGGSVLLERPVASPRS